MNFIEAIKAWLKLKKISEEIKEAQMDKKLWEYIKNRMSEASTWRGLIVLAGLIGVTLSPEQKEAIVTFGLALYGVIGTFFPDKPNGK